MLLMPAMMRSASERVVDCASRCRLVASSIAALASASTAAAVARSASSNSLLISACRAASASRWASLSPRPRPILARAVPTINGGRPRHSGVGAPHLSAVVSRQHAPQRSASPASSQEATPVPPHSQPTRRATRRRGESPASRPESVTPYCLCRPLRRASLVFPEGPPGCALSCTTCPFRIGASLHRLPFLVTGVICALAASLIGEFSESAYNLAQYIGFAGRD